MKKLKISLIVLISITAFIFFCRLDMVRIIFNDHILDICNITNYKYNWVRSYTYTSDNKEEWFDGLYQLEFCSVHNWADNSIYIVKLKDAQTGRVYKKALAKEVDEMGDLFYSRGITTNIGDGAIYFCLPRKDDLNKEVIEKRVGMPFKEFLKKQRGYIDYCI